MPATFDSIAEAVGTGSSNTITFSSIPQTYTDLQIVFSYQFSGNGYPQLRFNGDTTNTNYYYQINNQYSTTTAFTTRSTSTSNGFYTTLNMSAATVPGAGVINIFDYRTAGINRGAQLISSSFGGSTSGEVLQWSGYWNNTAAITSISIVESAGGNQNFTTNSKITLYGILRA